MITSAARMRTNICKRRNALCLVDVVNSPPRVEPKDSVNIHVLKDQRKRVFEFFKMYQM